MINSQKLFSSSATNVINANPTLNQLAITPLDLILNQKVAHREELVKFMRIVTYLSLMILISVLLTNFFLWINYPKYKFFSDIVIGSLVTGVFGESIAAITVICKFVFDDKNLRK